MDHAITAGDVLAIIGVMGGIAAAGAVLLGLLWLLNPFRSGH